MHICRKRVVLACVAKTLGAQSVISRFHARRKQAGLFARKSVYLSREERAASKFWAHKARAVAARAEQAVREGMTLVDNFGMQAEAVGWSLGSVP